MRSVSDKLSTFLPQFFHNESTIFRIILWAWCYVLFDFTSPEETYSKKHKIIFEGIRYGVPAWHSMSECTYFTALNLKKRVTNAFRAKKKYMCTTIKTVLCLILYSRMLWQSQRIILVSLKKFWFGNIVLKQEYNNVPYKYLCRGWTIFTYVSCSPPASSV